MDIQNQKRFTSCQIEGMDVRTFSVNVFQFVHSGMHQILTIPEWDDEVGMIENLFIATDGGIYVGSGFGSTYFFTNHNRGLNNVQINGLAVCPDGSIISGANNNACPFIEARVEHDGGVNDSTWYDASGSNLNHMANIIWKGNRRRRLREFAPIPSPAEPSSSLLPMALLAAAMPTSPTIPIPRPGPAMLISRPTSLPAAPPSAKSTCGKPITTLPPTTASHSPSIPSATSSATVLVTTFPRTSRLGLATPFWFSILPMPLILSITASTTASPSATNSATPSPLLI